MRYAPTQIGIAFGGADLLSTLRDPSFFTQKRLLNFASRNSSGGLIFA